MAIPGPPTIPIVARYPHEEKHRRVDYPSQKLRPEHTHFSGFSIQAAKATCPRSRLDRHRGSGCPLTPATPPCVRVRTRRFEKLGRYSSTREGRPSDLR